MKRRLFAKEVAVQTESVMMPNNHELSLYDNTKIDTGDEQETTLQASHLSAILRWSKDISSDINLSSGMDVLEPIFHNWLSIPSFATLNWNCNRYFLSASVTNRADNFTETSGSQNTCGSFFFLKSPVRSRKHFHVVIIAREAGDYSIATSMTPPEPCQVFEYAFCCSLSFNTFNKSFWQSP